MKLFKINFRLKKRYIITGIIILFLAVLLFFLSTIVRIWLVKNSEDLTGRKIDLKELHFNYLKFSVDAVDFKMYERNKTDIFVSFDELYINFDPWRLMANEYSFSEIRLIKPSVVIDYSSKGFNFDDLMESDTTAVAEDTVEQPGDTVRYVIKNLSISDGKILYRDKEADTKIDIKNFGMNVPLISWNSKQSDLGVEFTLGERGKVAVNGSLNQSTSKYSVSLKTKDIDLSPLANYFKPYIALSSLQGLLYSDVVINGDMSNPVNVQLTGSAGLKSIDLKDPDKKDFFAAEEIKVVFDTLDVETSNYKIRDIEIIKPGLSFILMKSGTNFDKVLAPYFAGDTAATEETDTTELHYSIKNLSIVDGRVSLSDLTLNRPFTYDLLNMNVKMSDYSDVARSVPTTFSINLNNSGSIKGNAVLDMVQTDNINLDAVIAGMGLVSFSPYTEYYVARPVKKGTFDYSLKLKMSPAKLVNSNHIKISKLEFGKKTKNETAYKVPVNLALYILKDRKGIIEFDLPVSGSPSDPNFKLGKIIWKTLENFLIKTATQPFSALGKLIGSDPESIKSIPFDFLQDSLESKQKQQLDKLCDIIANKPEIQFVFNQTTDPEKEASLIAVREIKRRYVQDKGLVSPSAGINEVMAKISSVKDNDPDFTTYVNGLTANSSLTLEEKCSSIYGKDKSALLLDELMNRRVALVKDYLLVVKKITIEKFTFKTTDLRNLPNELKKPGFNIEVTMQ